MAFKDLSRLDREKASYRNAANELTTQATSLHNSDGLVLSTTLRSDGKVNLDVEIQDQTTPAFDVFFAQTVGTGTLAVDANINEYTITVSPGHGITTGHRLSIYSPSLVLVSFSGVLDVSVNTITLDTPLNATYPSSDSVVSWSVNNMNVNGATDRQTFTISPPPGLVIDITRIVFSITCDTDPTYSDFGDITNGLTRGVVMRKKNGFNTNYFNIKKNSDISNLAFDVQYLSSTLPINVSGISARLTYSGQEKHGVAIRLSSDDFLEMIIQDDLTSLVSFTVIASGHVVE